MGGIESGAGINTLTPQAKNCGTNKPFNTIA